MGATREKQKELIKLYVHAEQNYLKTEGDRFWSDKMNMYEFEYIKISEKERIAHDPFYKELIEKTELWENI